MVGDGSYLMLNSELHNTVMLGRKLIVTVLDNRGYRCINRLQKVCGGAEFNNLIADVDHRASEDRVDFVAHARSLGAHAEKAASIGDLEAALARAKAADLTSVIVIVIDTIRRRPGGGLRIVGRGGARSFRAPASARGARGVCQGARGTIGRLIIELTGAKLTGIEQGTGKASPAMMKMHQIPCPERIGGGGAVS